MREVISALGSLENQMVLRAVLPVAAIAAIGIVIGRWDSCRHENTVIKLIRCIFLPCLVFSSIHKHAADPAETAIIGLAACFTVLGALVVARSFRGRRERADGDAPGAILFMSSGALLLPLALMLYGNEGLAKAVYFHLFVSFLLDTVGLYLIGGRTAARRFLKDPAFHAMLLGVLVDVVPCEAPAASLEFFWLIEKGIDIIANGAIPVLLISFGYPVSRLKLVDLRRSIRGGALRIVAAPLLAFAFVYLLRAAGLLSMDKGYDLLGYLDARTTEAVIVLGSALPASLACFGDDPEHGGAVRSDAGVFLCAAVGGVVTVPVTLFLINAVIFGA